MKLATLKGPGRDGRLVVVSRDLDRAVEVPRIAPTLQAALDDWAALAPRARAGSGAAGAGRARAGGRGPVRAGGLRGAPAARLPVRRRQRLSEPRGAGAPGARRRAAGRAPGRSADVPGRLGRLPRADRSDRGRRRGLGHRPRGRGRVITDDVPMGDLAGGGARPRQARDAAQRRLAAPPDPGRACQGLRLLPGQAAQRLFAGRGDARRRSAMPGATAGCTARSARASTAGSSAIPMPGSRCSSTSAG